ncbi:MAG TPA: ribonuclease Y [Nevskiaceae bacterium]|nr:ribonuclease Y [Nevskiaceae bacterium]
MMGVLDKLSKSLRERLNKELEDLVKREPKGETPKTGVKFSEANARAREIIADAKDEALKVKQEVVRLEAELDRRLGALEERERQVREKAKEIERELTKIEEIKKKEIGRLEKIGALTKQEAKEILLEAAEKRLSEQIARRIREAEEEVKLRADEKAKEILVEAMQHGVTDYVAEYTVSTVQLPDEEMKGRIIGREGRNIRAFERATGVEVELDEANVLHLSSFDSVRREIAKRALQRLIRDRRIQPARIEEVVKKVRQEMDKILFEEGEKLCRAFKVYRLHPELVKLLGRFKFRFSYGQNMIAHTLEETKIGVQLAYEVGANVNVVRLGCLLHDIGKVVTDEEGTHAQIGVDLALKYRLPKEVVACIAEHHEDKPFSSAESRIVWIADAASGSRPGARYEAHEGYLERMGQIEEIAKGFEGVREVFAYQAGRDVRVMVKPEQVSDDQLTVLADKIARALEEKASYAGQVKVTCIRESRVSETTKAK